nr:MAG TPA: Spike protein S2 PROTEIN [Caudoviricetes sp.]
MNKINEDIKFLTEVVNKIEEGFQIDVRLKYIRTINSFSVYPYLSEAQRSVIEDLVKKFIRRNLEDYRKEFEKL